MKQSAFLVSLSVMLLSGHALAQEPAPVQTEDTAVTPTEEAAPESTTSAKSTEPGVAPAKAPEKKKSAELPAWKDVPINAPLEHSPGNELIPNWDAAAGQKSRVQFPFVENHGYFRMRADLLHNFDLDTYAVQNGVVRRTSPFSPPLSARLGTTGNAQPNQGDAESLSGANVRFRYRPTIHVSEDMRIRTTIDMLDNLVLGSTPDGGPQVKPDQVRIAEQADVFYRPDTALDIFGESQRPPESGANGMRDSVRVKHAWGEWNTPLGMLVFGRTQSHWGLGLLANSGKCIDCDFGDSVDRIMGIAKVFDTYIAASWDFANEGYSGFSGNQTWLNQPNGQAYDYDQRDDVNQFVIAMFQKPHGRQELEARRQALDEIREPVFDWGFYNVVRYQEVMSAYDYFANPENAANSLTTDENISLFPVDAFFYAPDLWLDFQYRPTASSAYRFQMEAAAVFGSIETVPSLQDVDTEECVDPSEDLEDCLKKGQRQDIKKFGYAMEFDARFKKFRYGFHHGLATGDKQTGFGFLDNSQLPRSGAEAGRDPELTAFKFDRDYHVDLIMFRELIGGVTNATYFKPYFGYDFVQRPKEIWGFKLSTIYAFALESEATPGRESPLGLELDAEVYIKKAKKFHWSLAYGLLFPMAAFNRIEDNGNIIEPTVAQTIQMVIALEF